MHNVMKAVTLRFVHTGGLQVLNGSPYNRKCDVYSFGICLWEIYCCDMPYRDLSFSEVTSAVVRQVYYLIFPTMNINCNCTSSCLEWKLLE